MNAQETTTSQLWSERLAEFLFWPARILLLATVSASPWYYGSVTWEAQSYFVPVAALVFVLAIAGATLRRESVANPLVWCITALLVLAMLQTVRLPEWLWQTVASSAAFERSTVGAFDEFQAALSSKEAATPSDAIEVQAIPRTLSIHWVQTRASAVTFAAALAFLISAGILFKTRTWELVVLCVLAAGGLGFAMIGLLQSVAWNKWTLLPMPTSSYFATFVSRNSAPQYLSIGLGAVFGLLAWWSSTKSDGADKKYYVRYPAINAVARLRRRMEELLADLDAISLLCIFSATLMFVAVLAASSRGGILACFAASILTLCVSLGAKQSYVGTVGLVSVMACGALLLLTTLELDTALLNRMDSVNEEAYELDNGRFLVWKMILSAPWIWLPGCGMGNFHFAILPTYVEPTAWFYHAENIYLEVLAEFGVIGFAIAMCGIGWLLWRVRCCVTEGRRAAPSFIAVVFAGAAIGLQGLVDFSLVLPAVFIPMAVLVGCFIERSYSSDFGKKANRNSKHRRKLRDSADPIVALPIPAFRQTTLVAALAIAAIVLAAIGSGWQSFSGFVFAEQIDEQLKNVFQAGDRDKDISAKKILQELDTARVAKFVSHPEVNLSIGRVYQRFAAESFERHLKWPSELTALAKSSLSEPASVSAAFRAGNAESYLEQLRDLTLALPQQLEAIRRSAVRMSAAASVCNFDWRGEWGLVRSDLNLLTVESRARNYARLLNGTLHSASISARVGGAALMANEKAVGIRFFHDLVERVPARAIPMAAILVQHFPPDSPGIEVAHEIELILPGSALLRVEVAEYFSRFADRGSIAKQLAAGVDLEQLVAEAKLLSDNNAADTKSWLLVYWLAKTRADIPAQINALKNVVIADPMNHAMRFDLAKLYWELGDRGEALQQVERASRLAPESRPYKNLLERLRPAETIPVPP